MRISILGSGYVGIVTGAGFSELGHHVIFYDIDHKKLDSISKGESPLYEPGLRQILRKNRFRISVTGDIREAVEESDVSFICVGTPISDRGKYDLSQVVNIARDLGKALKDKKGYHLIVVKSTVFPRTTENVILPIIKEESGKSFPEDLGIAVNPEFLREGSAVNDFFHPDRIIVGAEDEKSRSILTEIYESFDCPKIFTDFKTAEIIKIVNNIYLATKISFANEIGALCKRLGIDTWEVFKAVGLDRRISPLYFRSGLGFGGSCLPKDLKAFISEAESIGVDVPISKSVLTVNERQPKLMIDLLKKHLNPLRGKRICVLGLAFKPNTDDVRESRSIPLIRGLLAEGADVVAYDPVAVRNFRKIFPEIEYREDIKDISDCDAVLIATDWEEFSNLSYTGKIVIDGRRLDKAAREAKIYEGLCW